MDASSAGFLSCSVSEIAKLFLKHYTRSLRDTDPARTRAPWTSPNAKANRPMKTSGCPWPGASLTA